VRHEYGRPTQATAGLLFFFGSLMFWGLVVHVWGAIFDTVAYTLPHLCCRFLALYSIALFGRLIFSTVIREAISTNRVYADLDSWKLE